MKLRATIGQVLMLGMLSVATARGAPPATVEIEIDFLLGYVEASGCEFYRNGSWHDGKEAQAHLRSKYRYLAAVHVINTTEDFIEKAGTRSSLSGLPYQVRCGGGPTQAAGRWLLEALARRRAQQKSRPRFCRNRGRPERASAAHAARRIGEVPETVNRPS